MNHTEIAFTKMEHRILMRSRRAAEARVAVLEEAARAWQGRALEAGVRRQAAGEAHRLAGVLGMFGLGFGSQLAAAAEVLLSGELFDDAVALRFVWLVAALRRELEVHAFSL